MEYYTACIWIISTIITHTNAYKILGVFPSPLQSHSIIGNALMKGLADKGHEITVISPYRMKDAPLNYRLIQTTSDLGDYKGYKIERVIKRTLIVFFREMYEMGLLMTNFTFEQPSVKDLLASEEKFDAVIVLTYGCEALFGLAEHYDAPLIAFSAFGANKWSTDLVGAPSPPSYVPNLFSSLTQQMTLFERIFNLAITGLEELYFEIVYLPQQRALFKKHFPKSKLGLDNIRKNTALVLVNSHVSIGYPRPYMPNMIEVGGLQINRKKKPLPADMQKFLDEAKDGAIYFSLGSSVNSSTLSYEKVDCFLKTFKALKQSVLWKFEEPNLANKSANVYINHWFPQDDILAHPNVKLFITQGGLLSTTESIYHGKPFIGMPMYSDPFLNMARAEAGGYGIIVNFNDLSPAALLSAIKRILNYPQYTKRIRAMSKRYRDQPMEPLDLATYWVEYIIRHKGAPHLHSAGQELSFIRYHNLDVIAILFAGIILVVLILMKALSKFANWFLRLLNRGKKVKTN